MLIYWVWLSMLSLSAIKKHKLLEKYGSPDKIYESSETLDKDLQASRQVLDKCREKGLKIIPFSHPAYPDRLKTISDPPILLYLRGTLPDLHSQPAIGVVGTRKCSPLGSETARKFAGEIAASGGIVVTGMALGVDAAAAWGAVEAGKPVVGVLGCGADRAYPKANAVLFEKVLEKGCILSEYPPETPVRNWYFPERNRIISGMSLGTLVVEAPEKSGALITARNALSQKRDVFVVPGAVSEDAAKGSNQLLRQGAKAVFSGWDVISEYASQYPINKKEFTPEPKNEAVSALSEGKKQNKSKKTEKIIIDKKPQGTYSEPVSALPELTAEEKCLFDSIPAEGKLLDDLIAASGLKPGQAFAALTVLEIEGLVQRLPGDRVARLERKK